jgi:hypothetical protein
MNFKETLKTDRMTQVMASFDNGEDKLVSVQVESPICKNHTRSIFWCILLCINFIVLGNRQEESTKTELRVGEFDRPALRKTDTAGKLYTAPLYQRHSTGCYYRPIPIQFLLRKGSSNHAVFQKLFEQVEINIEEGYH